MPPPIQDPRTRPVPAHMNAAFIDAPGGSGAIRYGVLPVPVPTAPSWTAPLWWAAPWWGSWPGPGRAPRDFLPESGSGAIRWARPGDRAASTNTCSPRRIAPTRLPPGVEAADAVALLHGAATAHLGLMDKARMAAGERLIILGSAGAVGSAAVQRAAEAGCSVIAVAGAPDADWVASLGAGTVLDYRDPDMMVKLGRAVAEDAPVVWDCSGSMAIDDQARLPGLAGRILHTAGIDAHQQIDTGALDRRDSSVHGFAISNVSVPDLALAAARLNALFTGPGICTRIGATLPLWAAAEAHRMLEAGNRHLIGGKIVVVRSAVGTGVPARRRAIRQDAVPDSRSSPDRAPRSRPGRHRSGPSVPPGSPPRRP